MTSPLRSLIGGCAKRSEDVTVAIVGLTLLMPVLIMIAALIYFSMGAPILFTQSRPGLGGKAFRLYKFRTMRNASGANDQPLPDALRLTRLGRFLRSTSIDEVPELINVLKGDMSLVGPRPLLMEYLRHYSKDQARRHEMRPGITGLAQINGRNATTWEERLRLDVQYIEHGSWWLDQWILLRTCITVMTRRGISAAGHATMPRLDGTESGQTARRANGIPEHDEPTSRA